MARPCGLLLHEEHSAQLLQVLADGVAVHGIGLGVALDTKFSGRSTRSAATSQTFTSGWDGWKAT